MLGVVPSQLRAAWPAGPSSKPPGLRVLLSWADRLPVELAQAWKSRVALFELLVASEYWLSLASDCRLRRDPEDGRERHLLRAVPGFDFVLYRDGAAVEEGRGEMLVAADLASPGYVDAAGGIGYADADALAFLEVGGRRYYRSRDRVHRFADGGLVYCGRVDQLAKSGGVWVDLETREAAVAAIDGVKAVAIVADAGSYTVNYVSEYVCIHMCIYIYIYMYMLVILCYIISYYITGPTGG